MQYHYNCRRSDENDSFGYLLQSGKDSIISHKSLIEMFGVGIEGKNRLKINENIDLSGKKDYFGDLYDYFLVFLSRLARLEKKSQKITFQINLYNSVNQNFFITHPSRLINQLMCNFTAIYREKRYKKRGVGSDFYLIRDFSEAQAWNNVHLHKTFDLYLPPDQSALASGTLIGSSAELSKQFHDDLITTGLIHVVVASGYNLTIVTRVMQSVVKRVFPKRIAQLLSLGSIWWYVGLALFNSAIVRSGWMASIVVLAQLVGRPRSVWRVLTLTVLLMVAIKPSMLLDISFQLSVSSTIGVIVINQRVGREMSAIHHFAKKERNNLVITIKEVLLENARTTIGANAFTLPIILYWFRRLSLISLIANVALLWIVPYVMSLSAVLLFLAHINQQLAYLSAKLVGLLASVFVSGVHFFAMIPYASVSIGKFSLLSVLVSYAGLYVLSFQRKRLRSVLCFLKNRKQQ